MRRGNNRDTDVNGTLYNEQIQTDKSSRYRPNLNPLNKVNDLSYKQTVLCISQ